jgi:hypothetical protein
MRIWPEAEMAWLFLKIIVWSDGAPGAELVIVSLKREKAQEIFGHDENMRINIKKINNFFLLVLLNT